MASLLLSVHLVGADLVLLLFQGDSTKAGSALAEAQARFTEDVSNLQKQLQVGHIDSAFIHGVALSSHHSTFAWRHLQEAKNAAEEAHRRRMEAEDALRTATAATAKQGKEVTRARNAAEVCGGTVRCWGGWWGSWERLLTLSYLCVAGHGERAAKAG